jgi:hypothetical protein
MAPLAWDTQARERFQWYRPSRRWIFEIFRTLAMSLLRATARGGLPRPRLRKRITSAWNLGIGTGRVVLARNLSGNPTNHPSGTGSSKENGSQGKPSPGGTDYFRICRHSGIIARNGHRSGLQTVRSRGWGWGSTKVPHAYERLFYGRVAGHLCEGLFVSQRDNGVDAHCPPRGNIASK